MDPSAIGIGIGGAVALGMPPPGIPGAPSCAVGNGDAGEDPAGNTARPMHKQRFVWTGELHRRFEAAVNTLGLDQAKPQAISQLMNCEGEGAPTRQNIKSHLQKYRLLMQKRARQGGASGEGGGGDGDIGGTGHSTSDAPTDVQNELEEHLARQEMNLKVQMDLQTKLHRQLLVQRQLQHQLEHCFPSTGGLDGDDCQRYHATVSLKNSLRERLTKHVMLQQEMLQHLDALVSSEASKTAEEPSKDDATDAEVKGEQPEGGAPVPDGPAAETSDGPVPDTPAPDGLAPDEPASDSSAPNAFGPDATASDGSGPDASVSDTCAADAPTSDASASDAGVPKSVLAPGVESGTAPAIKAEPST